MRKYLRHKTRITVIRHPAALRGLVIIIVICALIRAASALGAESAARGLLERLGDGAAAGILDFELGVMPVLLPQPTELAVMLSGHSQADQGPPAERSPPANQGPHADSGAVGGFSGGDSTDMSEAPEFSHRGGVSDTPGGLFYGGAPPAAVDSADAPSPLKVTPPASADDILLDNLTEYGIDAAALLREPLGITLTPDKPAVLIIHTHTGEAFTPSGSDTYEESDPFRTEDQSQNIVRIGDELTAAFEARGISVIHDTGSYDYPSYTGAYSRSYDAIRMYLDKYPSIGLVLDIHRDSISTPDGKQYKTVAQIGDVKCSQVMMVVGSDSAGLTHPKWRENLKLALYLQHEMNVLSPTLTRPVRISKYRYNQQATLGSLIIEIGCAGNTLEESLIAARYFADAAANVMLGLYG